VLSEKKAAQYFPGVAPADVVGKQITYNDDLKTTVTGVVKNLNENSSFSGDEFISVATITKTDLQQSFMMDVWNDWMAYSSVYIKLAKGATVANTEAQLKSLLKKYNNKANKDAANTMVFKLQPLGDIHFNNQYGGFGMRIASKPTLYGLLAIAAFLLLLGCINFINLTTAQATQRAKEIGIRKTMGSTKAQLVLQFLSETFVITLAATLLSVLLTPLLLYMFANFIPPGLEVTLLYKPNVILFLVLLVLLVSFLAGLYPALVLSGYKPVLVLKNQAYNGTAQTRSAWVRKTLTVSQFVIAQFFVIATIMVSKQIHYALTADMGMRKDAILNFSTPFSRDDSAATAKRQTLLNKIQSVPGVQLASAAFSAPAGEGASYGNIEYIEGKKDIKVNVQVRWGDSNYLKVYQIKLVAGRNFLKGDSSRECLINETYARDLGFQQAAAAVNKMINWGGKPTRIVGVMHDFHEHSMHAPIEPIVFRPGSGEDFHIALEPQNAEGSTWQTAIDRIGKLYASTYPDDDFSYTFFDDTIAKFYKEDTNTAHLLNWSTGLTVLISCLGLFGLVLYTTNTRTKEIGIRKILGASVSNIVTILSKDFLLLVVMAFVIAAPAAWWASHKWLEGFVYKTNISWWVFMASGLGMVLLALVTLSLQTIKAAMANPVGALRSE
jgi:ABC-type antimicrobial peptide transport system permease subunit